MLGNFLLSDKTPDIFQGVTEMHLVNALSGAVSNFSKSSRHYALFAFYFV